jgi:hypothetical protein
MTRQRKARGLLVLGAALALALGFFAVVNAARAQGPTQTPCPSGNMMNGGMMGQNGQPSAGQCAEMAGMMNMMSGGMMNANHIGSFGPGNGMMGAWTPPAELIAGAKPLPLDKATAVAKAYVAAWNSKTKLELGEVMQFNNHFYGEAIETETKRGAFEFLIDLATGTVYAEPGPNMMWNLRYGAMGSAMGLGAPAQDGDKMSITPAKAVESAQAYLDQVLPGAKVEDKPLAFYGYYTSDITRDGKTIGMLSVNGYTGQVWLHQWHGTFVAESSQQ